MKILTKIRPYLALIAGLVIVAVIAILVPWSSIILSLRRLSLGAVAVLLMMSVTYYFTKSIRFWIMLRQLGIEKPYPLVGLCYMAAQPMSLLPAGELYRTTTLKKYAGVPVHKSSPTVIMQGLVEAIVLLTAALIGAISLGENQGIVLGIVFVLAVVLIAIKRGWLEGLGRIMNKLPFVDINNQKLARLIRDNKIFLSRKNISSLLLLSIAPIAAGVVITYVATGSVGAHLSITQATIAYCLPVVLSGLSFLPGGLGASEGGTIGLLRLMNVAVPEAVAITLVVRIFTLGAGLSFGIIGALAIHAVEAKSD